MADWKLEARPREYSSIIPFEYRYLTVLGRYGSIRHSKVEWRIVFIQTRRESLCNADPIIPLSISNLPSRLIAYFSPFNPGCWWIHHGHEEQSFGLNEYCTVKCCNNTNMSASVSTCPPVYQWYKHQYPLHDPRELTLDRGSRTRDMCSRISPSSLFRQTNIGCITGYGKYLPLGGQEL